MSLSVRFDHHFASLDLDIAFEAPTPGVTALFGPSGCGKSTVVMAVAGLLRPDHCRIALDGAVLADTGAGLYLPPERRQIGMVFQDSRLFPHMSVLRNLDFGRRRMGSGPIRLDDVVDLLGIGHLLDRRPNSLSGGERQRVAIGRALLAQPLLLAMDEPLASLDGPRKSEILPFLSRLKTALKLPILYVTHATEELASIADTLVLLDKGQVVAAAPLEEAMTRSDMPFITRDDSGAVLTACVEEHDRVRKLTGLRAGSVLLWVPELDRGVGSRLRVRRAR
jgi:molybdate transport system ATP-binding protein